MDIEQLNYDFCDITDEKFQTIKNNNIIEKIDLKPEMFDYMLGDKSSLRYEHIKSITDNDVKINEMSSLLQGLLPTGLPDEFYDWYARECLDLRYTKYEMKDIKRKYKIQRKRHLELKKKEEKIKKQRIKYTKKNVLLTF